jgi:hypothetical protein
MSVRDLCHTAEEDIEDIENCELFSLWSSESLEYLSCASSVSSLDNAYDIDSPPPSIGEQSWTDSDDTSDSDGDISASPRLFQHPRPFQERSRSTSPPPRITLISMSTTSESGCELDPETDATIRKAQATQAVLHQQRQCKPCLYVHMKEGCLLGADCRFCHELHGAENEFKNVIGAARARRKLRREMLNKVTSTD